MSATIHEFPNGVWAMTAPTPTGARVVFRYLDGDWEPIHAMDAEGNSMALPSCFRPTTETVEGLHAALAEHLARNPAGIS